MIYVFILIEVVLILAENLLLFAASVFRQKI